MHRPGSTRSRCDSAATELGSKGSRVAVAPRPVARLPLAAAAAAGAQPFQQAGPPVWGADQASTRRADPVTWARLPRPRQRHHEEPAHGGRHRHARAGSQRRDAVLVPHRREQRPRPARAAVSQGADAAQVPQRHGAVGRSGQQRVGHRVGPSAAAPSAAAASAVNGLHAGDCGLQRCGHEGAARLMERCGNRLQRSRMERAVERAVERALREQWVERAVERAVERSVSTHLAAPPAGGTALCLSPRATRPNHCDWLLHGKWQRESILLSPSAHFCALKRGYAVSFRAA